MNRDGADTLLNIYYAYVGKGEKRESYYKWFSNLRKMDEQQPVVLLYDNEMKDGNRPLAKALNSMGIKGDKKDAFSSSLHANIVGNLHIMTHPLPLGENEGAIESLFDESTVGVVLDGKRLCLKDGFDTSKYFGK